MLLIRNLFSYCSTHVKKNDYAQFKAYSEAVNKNRTDHIRHLLEFKACTPIDIDQVETVSDIVKRFNTGR